MEKLESIFQAIDRMIYHCNIDFEILKNNKITNKFLENYDNVRVINSFLFNYSKIQDKIGSKLIKTILYEKKEIMSFSITMKDALNLLEKLEIIENVKEWDFFREIRNNLTHEYPFDDINEKIENINLCLESYQKIKKIYFNLKKFSS